MHSPATGELDSYHLLPSVRADLMRRFLERRLREVQRTQT